MPLPCPASDFPALSGEDRPCYLDSAATTLKPRAVVDAVAHFYAHDNAPVHRGVYALSARATDAYEAARRTVAAFVGAPTERLIFTSGTTAGLNLVAWAWGAERLGPGDDILVSPQEHHSNFLPWRELARRTGATLRRLPLRPSGVVDEEAAARVIGKRTRLVAMAHVSNVLGVENPVAAVFARAREVGAVTVLDGAQSVPTRPVDFAALGCDALAFSGHKMLGPTGIGGLAVSDRLMDEMGTWQTGGGTIDEVTWDETRYLDTFSRFEAGTPHAAGAVGLAAACAFLSALGMSEVARYERAWGERAVAAVRDVPGVRLLGPPEDAPAEGGIVTLQMEGAHPHDLAVLLDAQGVMVRAGHHCAMPLHQHLGGATSLRASAYVYNTPEDADRLAEALAFAHRALVLRKRQVPVG